MQHQSHVRVLLLINMSNNTIQNIKANYQMINIALISIYKYTREYTRREIRTLLLIYFIITLPFVGGGRIKDLQRSCLLVEIDYRNVFCGVWDMFLNPNMRKRPKG